MIDNWVRTCRGELGFSPAGEGLFSPRKSATVPARRPASGPAGAMSKKKAGQPSKAVAEKDGNRNRIKLQASEHTDRAPEHVPPEIQMKKAGAPPVLETPKISISATFGNPAGLYERFASGSVSGISKYFLAQQASRLSRADHFDSLICLSSLKNIEQYHYQIETVRKVMRSFRGRVFLADEVGLGKTIEAGMVLKEYMLRGMVKKTLVLTPPPS